MGRDVERTVSFTPTRVDNCAEYYVVIGSLGELAKLDRTGNLIGEVCTPFASTITHSIPLDDSWIGIWVEPEMRLARMAGLKIEETWRNGPSSSELRTSDNPMQLHPENSTWSHALDAEPTCITGLGDVFCFVLRGRGVYLMDSEANEVWRSSLPNSNVGRINGIETAISISNSEDKLSIWYDNGLIVDISLDTGLEIDRRKIKISERIERVFHGSDSHILALSQGGFLLSDNEGIVEPYKTPGPLLSARQKDGIWELTGWRFDAIIRETSLDISSRDQLGVGFIEGKILTNDGTLSEFSFNRS